MRTDPFNVIPSPLGLDTFHRSDSGVFQPTVSVGGEQQRVAGDGTPSRLVTASNVDVEAGGDIKRRTGFASIRTLTTGQGTFAANGEVYYQAAGVLYRKTTSSQATLLSGLSRFVTVIPMHQGIFVSDGTTHRQLVGDTVYVWGQAAPALTLGTTTGSLVAGKYLIQAAFVDLQGNEGPASAVVTATVAGTAGITINTTIPAGSASVNIYISGVEQAQTNFLINRTQVQLPYSITSAAAYVGDTVKTAQMIGPIAGLTGGCAFRSFVLLWRDNFIIRSEAFEPHLYHPNNIMQFPSTVRAAAGVDDGLWVGTDKGIWWVTGEDPGSFVPFQRETARVLAGSITLPGTDLPVAELGGDVVVFATEAGLVALGSTGQMKWLTKTRYGFSGTSASFAFVRQGDVRQLFVVS